MLEQALACAARFDSSNPMWETSPDVDMLGQGLETFPTLRGDNYENK